MTARRAATLRTPTAVFRPGASSLTRRRALAVLLLVPGGLAAGTGCTREEPEPAAEIPTPVSEIGSPVPSPSGRWSAVLDTAGAELGVLLRDADGADVWADGYDHDPTDPPRLVWQLLTGDDVLWVLPPEGGAGGPARISHRPDGGWQQEQAADPPQEIRRWL